MIAFVLLDKALIVGYGEDMGNTIKVTLYLIAYVIMVVFFAIRGR